MNYKKFCDSYNQFSEWEGKEDDILMSTVKGDAVNHPSHYTNGKTEVIEVIEDAVVNAPEPVVGMLQGQVLKYLLRLWLKENSLQDARKAQWYLTRLIEKLT